jgi:hypothetical protein
VDGFLLNEKGDVVIESDDETLSSDIVLISDNDLIEQTVRQVLRTNLGEWWLNEDEGIDFYVILTKNPNFEEIRNTINLGLQQVDESFTITDFNCTMGKDRKLTISFTAENENEEEIQVEL